MTPDQVIKHFRTQAAAAAAIGVSQPAVSNWVTRGAVPLISQLRLEAATGGKLKADRSALSVKKAPRK